MKLSDPGTLLHHNEPVLRDGVIVGQVTGGAFTARLGTSIGLYLITLPEGEAG